MGDGSGVAMAGQRDGLGRFCEVVSGCGSQSIQSRGFLPDATLVSSCRVKAKSAILAEGERVGS